jgi:Predicted membrane protein (DUF2306)
MVAGEADLYYMESKKAGRSAFRPVYWAVIFLSLIGVAIVAIRATKLAPFLFQGRRPASWSPERSSFDQADLIFARFPVLTMVHILVALSFILMGPFQVSGWLRKRYPNFQRKSARLFLICGFIMGTTALVMSFVMRSIGGVNQAASTVLFGALFLFALICVVRYRRNGDSRLQREWLIRAYAIALAVTSVRLVVGVFFATSRLSGLKPDEFFGIAFWIGFVIHLMLAEAWIYRARGAG